MKMRERVQSLTEDFRLDFVKSDSPETNDDVTSLPDISKKHPRLYKSTRRDHDMTELDDPHLVEMMRRGTIPPSLSLRAPPTHIGTSQQRSDILGITKEEVSKRYIVKLRRERLRNNEAVYKSLDNLPIKIRQVAQNSFHKGTKSSSSSVKSKESTKSAGVSDIITTQQYTKPFDPTWSKLQSKNLRKQKPKAKVCWKSEDPFDDSKSKCEDDANQTLFEPSSFSVGHSEMPYIFSAGFQGHQNRIKFSKRKQVGFGQTVSSNDDFKRQYKRILDTNQQPHFVKSSLVKGQRVINNKHKFKSVPYSGEDKQTEELFAIKSVQKINEQFLFTSPASPTRVPNPSLYSECQNSDVSLNINGHEMSPRSHSASSTLVDRDSDKSCHEGFKENNANSKIESRQVREIQNDTTSSIPVLSQELLRVHEHETSAQNKKTNKLCNLTDITERDESNLTKTSRSETGQDVKISVLINYKAKEDAIEEHGSSRSASSTRSKSREMIKQFSKNSSFESRKNLSSLSGTHSDTQLEKLRVDGHLFGDQDNVKRDLIQDKSDDMDLKTSSPINESGVQQIIVDLNRLKTVKTPIQKHKECKSESRLEEQETEIASAQNTEKKEERGDFFLTYDEVDSAMSHYNDLLTPKETEDAGVKGVKDTPRTEIDDSGISISTMENEAIKC